MTLVDVLERARALGLLGPGPVEAHIDHAAGFAAVWAEPPRRLLDLGSGGGVPGLVLAERWPDTEVWLLDAQERRAAFLRQAIADLALDGRVGVLLGRAEVLARDRVHRHAYDAVTARSFGPPAVTAECAVGFLDVGGMVAVAEPPGAPDDRWPAAGLARLGLVDAGVGGAAVSIRCLVARARCEERFPRRTGVPARRPLF